MFCTVLLDVRHAYGVSSLPDLLLVGRHDNL